jgi:hypothetical protein
VRRGALPAAPLVIQNTPAPGKSTGRCAAQTARGGQGAAVCFPAAAKLPGIEAFFTARSNRPKKEGQNVPPSFTFSALRCIFSFRHSGFAGKKHTPAGGAGGGRYKGTVSGEKRYTIFGKRYTKWKEKRHGNEENRPGNKECVPGTGKAAPEMKKSMKKMEETT